MSTYEWLNVSVAVIMAVTFGALVWRVTHPK